MCKKTSIGLLFFLLSSLAYGKATLPNLITDDLTYWNVPKGNDQYGWYEVQDGVLMLRSSPNKKHSVLKTKKSFRDFICSFEFRFVEGNIDSGIELRNNDQIQIGISGSLKRDMTGSPYIPGKGYPKHAKNVEKLIKLEGWNQMSIRCVGPSYVVSLQGKEVVEYNSPRAIEKGPLGIQLHGNRDMKIDFRNFSIKSL